MKGIKTKLIVVLALMALVLVGGAGYVLATGVTLAPRGVSAAPLYDQNAVTAIYDSTSPAVVEIKVTQGAGSGRFMQTGQGSGFLVDNQGRIVTNNHVVDGATTVQVLLKNGKTVDGKVLGTDAIDDLALISVDSSAVSGITPLALGHSSAVKPGQMAIAIGSPYGLNNSVTVGVISGLDRSLGGGSSLTGMLQTDAAVNPGNSGGPLLDDQGKVIGVVTAVEAAAGARGIGFAVPSDVVSRVLPSLVAGQQVARPWLGISGTALTAATAKSLGISVDSGVYIVTVVPNGPAEKAGLKGAGTGGNGALGPGGDVVTAVDGKSVASVEELSAYLTTKQVGDKVSLSVLRGGQSMSVQVTLEARPANITTGPTPQPRPNPMPNIPWPWGGRGHGD